MLLMDGVRYLRHDYRDEAELESMVKEHATDIFGEDSLYFDIKQKVGGSSVAAIPDGYAITFNPDQWWMVEVELSSHDVYGHIQPQIGKFLASIGQHQTKVELQNRLFSEINSDDHTKLNLHRKKGTEIFKFLSDLLGQTPKVAIIIDHKVPALADLKKALPTAPEVIEFATFCREGVGPAVHIHMFEPLLVSRVSSLPESPPERTIQYTKDAFWVYEVGGEKIPESGYIHVPREKLSFFPPFDAIFSMETETNALLVKVLKVEREGGRGEIHGEGRGLKDWYAAHPEVKVGSQLRIEALEPHKRYRLSIVST